MTAVTPLARASLYAWPSSPKPVTSVPHRMPAFTAAALASRFNVVIAATAAGNTSPVDLCRLLSTPLPSGLVRQSGVPGVPLSSRIRWSTSTVPVTASPYFGSASSMLCPPARWQPAAAAMSWPPRSTSRATSMGSCSRGQASRLSATSGVPPMAYTSESALQAAIRPKSYGSSTTGVKKSVVATSAVPPSNRITAASSPPAAPTSRSGPGGSAESPASRVSSSPGGILQAQSPPRAYWVSLRTVISELLPTLS